MPEAQPNGPASASYLSAGTPNPALFNLDNTQLAELDEASVLSLLAATDDESISVLESWLKVNSRSYAPLVVTAAENDGLSPEAACAVLDALLRRAPADEDNTLILVKICLGIVAGRISATLSSHKPGENRAEDDPLVGRAVGVVTSNRRSRHSETAIGCLAEAGPGGVLVLARAFDAIRADLQLYVVRRVDPAEVRALGDNVVASMAFSASKLAEELEGRKQTLVKEFVAALGAHQSMESAEIGVDDPLEPGSRVFHARWGAGVVLSANKESATIDFSGAGTRTLLRSLTTLRRAD